MNQYRLIEIIQSPPNFIFEALDELDIPWKEDDISAELDLYYVYNHAGQKEVSPMVRLLLDTVTHKLSTENLTKIANTLYAIYNQKWGKLYATYSLEYNPISNYDMLEQMTNDTTTINTTENSSLTRDVDNTVTHGKTDTTTNNLTNTENGETTVEREVAAFNSSEYVPSEHTTENITNHITTNTGTQAVVSSGSDTDNTDISEEIHRGVSDTHTRNYTLTRSGNIGVTSSQQLIESERNLWLWNFFENVVFPDIDHALTLPYYGGV